MIRHLFVVIALLVPRVALASLSPNSVWEVRGGSGADTNGGGFVTGASGTDWSQYNNKNAAGCSSCGSATVDLSVTDGVTAGTTTVTSATANFDTSIVGNIIYIAGGTGSVAADWYQVTARGSSTSVTVDRSTGLTAGTGVTINIGGALATLTAVATEVVTSNNVHVKNATYAETLTLTVSGGNGTPIHWHGYNATRGDNPIGTDRPLIDAASTRANCVAVGTTVGNMFFNFRLSGATGANAESGNAGTSSWTDVKSSGAAGDCWKATTGSLILERSEASTCGGYGVNAAGAALIIGGLSNIHDNTLGGVNQSAAGTSAITFSLIEANAGPAVSMVQPITSHVINNTIDGNTGVGAHGFTVSGNRTYPTVVSGNIFSNNGGTAIIRAAANAAPLLADYNNLYLNGATYSLVTAGAHDLTLDPGYVDAAGGNFAITNAALKDALGPPFAGGLTTGYAGIGAVEAACAASGGGQSVLGGGILR